ncbi:MAG: hypothetical protein RL427_1233 [Bacteroidota bacterium]|jgi:hypothetical protein
MKYLLITLITLTIISCKSPQLFSENSAKNAMKENELTTSEKEIINEFLALELAKDLYSKYRNLEIFVIEEALKKSQLVDAYHYSIGEWNSMNQIKKSEDLNKLYFIDSIQLNNIKKEIAFETPYLWKESDFNFIKTKMVKHEALRSMINARNKEMVTMKPILDLSRPLLINDSNALISFEMGNFQGVYNSTAHFTVLLRKINHKWVEYGYYEDGVFN